MKNVIFKGIKALAILFVLYILISLIVPPIFQKEPIELEGAEFAGTGVTERVLCIDDTLYFGGMLINMWMWSGHACASMISTLFCWHNFRSIIPMSSFIFPYISIRLYFGANTTWY